MKKLLLFAIMFLFASLAMAQATFSPSVMEITCPAEINYDFGDVSLDIPFNVSGVPGAFWLVINTHGKADEITGIRNGFLGWHYVTHIDTTVYVSGRYQRELGDVKIVWDGTNSDGEKVAEDTYSYYIWGYDDKSSPQLVTNYVEMANKVDAPHNVMVTHDEQGMVRVNPMIFGNRFFNKADDTIAWKRFGTAYKWVIGSNPEDLNNLETTWMPFYVDAAFATMYQYGQPVLDLQDNNIYYHVSRFDPGNARTLMKWEFIPGGDAEQDMEYMGWDTDSEWEGYATAGQHSERNPFFTNPDGSEPYMYLTHPTTHIYDFEHNPLTCINKDEGEIVFRIQMHEMYYPDDNNERGEINNCPETVQTRGGNLVLLGSWMGCLQEMVDTTNLFENQYDEDYVRWQNANGDYFMDKFCWEDTETPWSCLGGFAHMQQSTGCALDQNMFSAFFRATHGTTALTVVTQDGTAIADMSFYGLDYSGRAAYNSTLLDCGSQYDGFYTPQNLADPEAIPSIWYLTFDSAGGMIIPGEVQPGVEEKAQGAYSIEQNAPNPFNPTTTIGFTLAEAGDVNIDVYNVAGQKVDTLVNDFMESGSHSVVWDASGFSAGVYFYTIKSGDFSRTMKMTLLK